MKRYVLIAIVLLLISLVVLMGCNNNENQNNNNEDLFRIHIVANSNLEVDSKVKYQIKDEYSKFLTSFLANCKNKNEVENIVSSNLNNLKSIADNILKVNGLNYTAKVKISNEYFPNRVYGDFVVESGFYDGVTVVLGEGKGDNWWCVMFPPLCYYNTSITNSSNIVYKSKIMAIIREFFKN